MHTLHTYTYARKQIYKTVLSHTRVVAQQYMSSCSLALSEADGSGASTNAMLLSGDALNKAVASLPPEVCVCE